ncbi:hypothetical protein VST7929_02995 [Vibrio stylophorae]|uniref:Cache domain-containing protein n=1 Tax=Vibrio stylophorae TaxID=659351 RepID=A0ABM8ZXF4_9VIBR|nr:hypothetical protein [Vibrio stylophorae]CAH0535422.1 hypothetical protein VST7929_02995 [Vibrio stylophorae]
MQHRAYRDYHIILTFFTAVIFVFFAYFAERQVVEFELQSDLNRVVRYIADNRRRDLELIEQVHQYAKTDPCPESLQAFLNQKSDEIYYAIEVGVMDMNGRILCRSEPIVETPPFHQWRVFKNAKGYIQGMTALPKSGQMGQVVLGRAYPQDGIQVYTLMHNALEYDRWWSFDYAGNGGVYIFVGKNKLLSAQTGDVPYASVANGLVVVFQDKTGFYDIHIAVNEDYIKEHSGFFFWPALILSIILMSAIMLGYWLRNSSLFRPLDDPLDSSLDSALDSAMDDDYLYDALQQTKKIDR